MSIEAWMVLWKIVLIAGIALFAALAVVVTIGGFFDVTKLIRRLKEEHAEDLAEPAAEEECRHN